FTNHAVVSFVLAEDNSQQQDEQVMNYQRRKRAGLINQQEEQQAKELLWNIQRTLEPVRVINPYAEKLLLPQELKDKQITNAHYLQFIEIISFFKQFQKKEKVDESTGEIYIETSIEDIQEANELLGSILLNKCDGLNAPTRKY